MLGMILSMDGQLYGYTSVEHASDDTVKLRKTESVLRVKIERS